MLKYGTTDIDMMGTTQEDSGAGGRQLRVPIFFHNLSELLIQRVGDLMLSTPYSLGHGPFF